MGLNVTQSLKKTKTDRYCYYFDYWNLCLLVLHSKPFCLFVVLHKTTQIVVVNEALTLQDIFTDFRF